MVKHTGLALAVVVALALVHAPLHAQSEPETTDVDRAEAMAAEAFDAFTLRDYPRAIALYRQALEASPSADIIYNLARIYDTKQKNRQLAIEYYDRYRNDPGADPDRTRIANERVAVLHELETMEAQPARPPAANSGPSTETTAPIPASPRTQRGGGDGLSGTQLAGLFIGAVGVASLGVGTGFGLAANADADTTHELCEGNACTSQRGVNAAEDATKAATISTVSFIAGGALLATGLTLILLGNNAGEEHRATLALEPYVSPKQLGTQLTGRW